jgi:hypothetical protein
MSSPLQKLTATDPDEGESAHLETSEKAAVHAQLRLDRIGISV